MPKFLRNIAVPEALIAADGVLQYDLAVNPLSVVLLELRPLNDTGTLANFTRPFDVCKALNRVSIMYLGQSILSMRGEDLAALNHLRYGMTPWDANNDNVDNERRCVTLPIFMGRMPLDPTECFPATRRGELVLECDFDIADTGYDGLRFSVATVEIPDAKPKQFERKVQIGQTFGATGTNDVDLYSGLKNRGILLFGTTSFDGAAPAPSWGRIRLLLDNQELSYSNADWETLMSDAAWLHMRQQSLSMHRHTYDGSSAGIAETPSMFDVGEEWKNYAYLDFDPFFDDAYTIDTGGGTRFQIRAEAETADAVRVVQVEVLPVSGLVRPA